MRIRTIKPEFWAHPVMSKQSDSTKLLAIGLLNVADDDGYFYADPRMIRNLIRPLDDDSRIATVSLRELSEIGYIEIRKHESHGDIGFIPNFLTHQVINKAKTSKIKAFFDSGNDTVSILYRDRPERNREQGNKGTEKGLELISCPIPSDESEILKMIWSNCPKEGRERSGKQKLADAWRKIPAKDKPSKATIETALKAWNASNKWQTGFCEGIEKWVKNRQWENLPESQEILTPPTSEESQLMALVDTVRQSWQKIPWNSEDRAALIKYKDQLNALTHDDLQLLKAFFESTAEGYFRPDNRSKFCESLSGIWTACERWKKATNYKAPNSKDSLYHGS